MDDFDPVAIDGLFSEPVILADHRLVLGLMHMDGAGIRVCAWDGADVRHMSPAAARRLAKSLEAEDLGPVVEALELLADRVDTISARPGHYFDELLARGRRAGATTERAQKFAEMPVEGNA